MRKRWARLLSGVGLCVLAAGPASAHPHVFSQARMEIVGDQHGKLRSIRNIWRMDELFSTSVVVDFDKNANNVLDDNELQAVGDTVKQSIAEYSFYTFVKAGGQPVKLSPPKDVRALFEDGQLLIFFEMEPAESVDLLKQPLTVSNFDETFFVAFDYDDENSFQLVDMPKSCTKTMVVPDEDEAAKQYMASIATLGPDQTVPADGVDYSQILATRLEVTCR